MYKMKKGNLMASYIASELNAYSYYIVGISIMLGHDAQFIALL